MYRILAHTNRLRSGVLYLWLLLLWANPLTPQQLQVLSPENQERIARWEELATRFINNGEYETAISYLNQISYTYWENGRPDRAIASFERTATYYEKINDLSNLQKVYSNIGLIYLDMEEVENAERNFGKSLQVQRRMGDPRGITTALVDLAYVKNLLNDHREAVNLLAEARDIAQENNFESVLPNIYKQLANSYTSIGNIREGEKHHRLYNDIREHVTRQTMRGEFQEREEKSQLEIMRSQAEARARELEIEINRIRFEEEQDSIAQIVKAKEDSLIRARQRDSLQRQSILLLERESQLQEAEIDRQQAVQNFQQLIIYSVLGGLVLLLFLALLMYRSNKAKQKANRQLAAKNQQIEQAREELQEAFVKIEDQNFRITQSISYAREIQRAMFPPQETLQNFLPESFIFFKPVDMVSGDFYWFKEAGQKQYEEEKLLSYSAGSKESFSDNRELSLSGNGSWLPFNSDKFIVSAVDCTGHGVPGAFMSMIGYNLLDSITAAGVTHAGKILEHLHYGVRDALKQEETTNRDGMDISLCVIDKEKKTVEFAGANNPIIYIRNHEMSTIKGSMMPIGGSQKKKSRTYEAHTLTVDEPTWFYILTDGYTDQFGGESGRKFMMKNFKELIFSIYQKPMEEQKRILKDVFDQWKGKEHQMDDVLVIGFKLG